MAVGGRVWVGRIVEERLHPGGERVGFLAAEEFLGAGVEPTADSPLQPPDAIHHRVGQGLAGESPHHGAEFGLGVKRQTVIDAPDPPRAVGDHVSGLAVGVVDHQVQGDDRPEARVGLR